MLRYTVLSFILTLVAVLVVAKTAYIMTAKRDFWMQVADRVKVDSLQTPSQRGNILSCDGQLLASSLPQYKVFIDFKAIT